MKETIPTGYLVPKEIRYERVILKEKVFLNLVFSKAEEISY